MKTLSALRASAFFRLFAIAVSILALNRVAAFEKPSHRQLPDVDKRAEQADKGRERGQSHASQRQAAATRRLQSRNNNVKVDFHDVHGAPQWIRASQGIVSEPIAAAGNTDASAPIKAFVNSYADLFGHDAGALSPLTITRQYTNSHNGVRTFAWEQRLDGIPVYESVFLGHVGARGELISVSSTFVPELDQLAAANLAGRALIEAAPPLPLEEAIGIAAAAIEQLLDPAMINPVVAEIPGRAARFTARGVPGEIEVQLTWLALGRSEMRLCWQVELTRQIGGERYRVLVDVESAEILLRRCLTVYAVEATYRVFTSDSPTPFTPGFPAPNSNQPPIVARSLVTIVSLSTNASPIGWMNEGENQTRGNNVDAHLDRNADDYPDLPRPQGSPFRVFDFPQDLTQSPSTYGDAAVVQLFYWCNWMHDQLYDLGFDEAAGNYQKDNFGRGGIGNDAVQADAQDGSGVNNANFTPTIDGTAPRIQMYVFDGPNPDRDGDFDAEVVLHEYTHGLSDRLVGGGVGISALQTAGMGEGWSDFYAMTLLSEPGDDIDGTYPMGAYASYQLAGLAQNYYFGIRRYPYSTDLSKSPLTFKDIDPAQAVPHSGVPISPINPFNPFNANEVHAQGEVWCVTLWEVRANLIRKHGFSVGNRLVLQLVTDGMKLSPANPTFVQARDAILLADEVDNGGANVDALWAAFSKRGLGFSAKAPTSALTDGSVEAFDLPDFLSVVPNAPLLSSGTLGGPFSPLRMTYGATNQSSNTLSWSVTTAAPWLTLSSTGGTLPPLGGTSVTVCIASNAAGLPPGVYQDSVLFSNRTTHYSQARPVELRITAVAQVPFNDGFESGRLEGYWLATGTGPFRTHVTGTDSPHSGAFHVTLDTDASGEFARNELTLTVDLGGYTNAMLRFWAKNLGDEPDGPPDSPFINGADFDGVAISQDGVRWYEAQSWRNLASTYREYVVDLDKAIATFSLNYSSSFHIRFNRYDDNPIPFDGFALDDVSITGTAAYRYTVSAPSRVREGSGVLSNQGQVTLAVPPPANVTLQLASSDSTRLSVPASVVIPAGSASATFDLNLPDDGLLNGTETVTISVSAPGYFGLPTKVIVDDNETATIRLHLPAKAVEGAGMLSKSGSIKLNRKADRDVHVMLTVSDPILFSIPSEVIVPAGQSTAAFDIIVNDDHALNGVRVVQVTAHVENWVDAVADTVVSDDDTAVLLLSLPARVSEGNGTLTNVAVVRLAATASTNVVVSLISSSPTELQVPAQVMVPAGQDRVGINLTVIDDPLVNGLRSVSITASAPGFKSATGQLSLLDDETPPTPYDPVPANGAQNVAVTTGLSWKPGFGEVLVNGGFETGDFTGWRLENADYGSFYINDGKLDPEGTEGPSPPYAGKFSAVTSQIGSGQHLLYQDVLIPADAKAARLSWVDKIHNYADRYVPFGHEFRVEIRDVTNNVLATLFVTKPGDPLTNDWTRRSFDVTQFRGQLIRVAFVERDFVYYFNLHLDEISLFLEDSGLTTFDVYFGTNSVFSAADLLGTATNASWALPRLALNTTYYWQIVEHRTGMSGQSVATTAGPTWHFTTRDLGSLHHFDWSAGGGSVGANIPLASPQRLDQPFAVSVMARDDIGNLETSFNGSAQISGVAGPTTAPTVVITEIDTAADDRVEFQNVSGRTIDLSSWKISLYDRLGWPAPRVTITIPTNNYCPSGALFQLFRLGTPPGSFPAYFNGTNIAWVNSLLGNPVAVLLRDANDNVVDFVCAFGADPGQIKNPFPIPHTQWLANAIPANTNTAFTLQRIGGVDHNDARDWVARPTSVGTQNDGLTLPFSALTPVSLTPTTASFSSGVWTGQVTVREVVTNLALLADDGVSHVGLSSRFDVVADTDLALGLSYSPDQTIPGDQIQYVLTVQNGGAGAAPSTEVVLRNTLAPTAQFVSAIPSQGECQVVNGLLECSLHTLEAGSNATVTVVMTSTGPGSLTNVFTVARNEPETYLPNNIATAISTVNLPQIAINDVSVNENNTTANATFTVRLSARSTLPVTVSYRTADRTAVAGSDYVAASGIVTFPPGSTNQPLVITVLGDTVSEAFEQFEVNLFSPINAVIVDAQGVGRIFDDDLLPTIRIADATITEPAPGGATNVAFAVTLSTASAQQISVNFTTSNGTAMAEKDYVPELGSLVFPPGVTATQIIVSVLGDKAAEPSETFFIHLSNPMNGSIGRSVAQGTILDNGFSELDHFNFTAPSGSSSSAAWPSPQYAGIPFVAPIAAKDARNNLFGGFAGRVSIKGGIPRGDVSLGVNSTSLWNTPFGTLYEDARAQVIYLASELGGAADFAGVSFFVNTPPGQTLSNWTIRLKHTTFAKYVQPVWETQGWQIAYQNHESVSATGWVSFLFTTPFHYDGTNNLLVDLSFNNNSYTSDGMARFYPTTDSRTLFFRTDSAFGDPLRWSGPGSPPPTATNAAPAVRFIREDIVNVSPTLSTDFVSGVANPLVTVNQAATNMVLRVSDGAGHNGVSDLFTIESAADLNGDGLPDSWQLRNFGAGAPNSGPNDDPDHDGFTNLQEFYAGSDPMSASSALRITDFAVVNGSTRLQFQTVLGKAYRLERATDPASRNWIVVSPFIVGTGTTVQVLDTNPGTGQAQFYRIRLLP